MATILPDTLTRLRPTVDLTVQPVAPNKEVSEALSRLSAGQRVFAEILTALPNGTYRAVVNQRDLVLSLPFSAKAGDSLELEVVDSDGRVAFAVVPKVAPTPHAPPAPESAPANLSPAARLISQLLGESAASPSNAKPLPLAGGAPLLNAPPTSGSVLAPVLQKAVESSGLFYEAHQARWLDGGLRLSSLQGEPQNQHAAATRIPERAVPETPASATSTPAASRSAPADTAPTQPNQLRAGISGPSPFATDPAETAETVAGGPATTASSPPLSLSRELAPVVQQQLQALANGTHLWHGQVWPGQQMEWEIIDDEAQKNRGEGDGTEGMPWRTRLRLVLPALGEVVADLRLLRDSVEVCLVAPTSASRLSAESDKLQNKLALAGMRLAALTVDNHER